MRLETDKQELLGKIHKLEKMKAGLRGEKDIVRETREEEKTQNPYGVRTLVKPQVPV